MFENYFGLIILFLIVSGLSIANSLPRANGSPRIQPDLREKTKSVPAAAISYSSPQESTQLRTAIPSKAEILAKRELLSMILGDLKVFSRLTDFELRRNPKLNFAEAIQEAIDRLRYDIGRN